MSQGEFYQGGMDRFQKEGYPTPRNVEFPSVTFEQKLEQLRAGGAAEIAEKYDFGRAIAELLKTHSLDELRDPAFCEAFLFKYPKFSEYHPALVLAVAEEIKIGQNTEEAHRKKLH